MIDSNPLPRKPLLLIAFLQAIALMFLYEASESGTWPSAHPIWAFPLWTLSCAVPTLLLLALDRDNWRAVLRYVGGFAAILTVLAAYIGWQAEPVGEFRIGNLIFVFILATGLACFKALMYIQQRSSGRSMTYDVLFRYSWRNFLALGLAVVFTFVFWMILRLWAALFNAIGIEFFEGLFEMSWFLFPALSLAEGLGIIIFRSLTNIIDSITRILQALIKMLLPLVLVVSLIFLAALPFVGLDALWDTRNGTALLLWLLAIALFFTNAVYQDGRGEPPYPRVVHLGVSAAMLVLPVVSALSFYGLYLRLDQYGWTVERAWAFVIWLLLTLFAVGYFVGVVRRRERWTEDLARTNTIMGLVVLGIMLLSISPLLDFRKLSLNSQVARVESGEIEWEDFDFRYAYRNLARPGYLMMDGLKAEIGDSDPDLLTQIENAETRRGSYYQSGDEIWASASYRPAPFDVPQAVRKRISQTLGDRFQNGHLFVFRTDLDNDGEFEYVSILESYGQIIEAKFHYRKGDDWKHAYMRYTTSHGAESLLESLAEDTVVESPSPWEQLRIGDIVLSPHDAE